MVDRKRALIILETVFGKYTKGTRKGSPQYSFFSPFVDHHKPKLEVRVSNDTIQWSCWITKKGGYGISSLLIASKQTNLLDQARIVDKGVSFKKKAGKSYTDKIESIKMPADSEPIWKRSPNTLKALMYLRSRGLSMDTIQMYQLHYSPSKGIVFPSYDQSYNLRGIFYRWPNSKFMMGDEDNVDHLYFGSTLTSKLPVVAVEGFFDIMSVKGNTTMMGGTYLPIGLCRWASAYDVPVILYTDGDKAGQESSFYSAKKLLTYGVSTFIAECPDGKDPGDLTSDENWMVIDQAKEYTRYDLMSWEMERK